MRPWRLQLAGLGLLLAACASAPAPAPTSILTPLPPLPATAAPEVSPAPPTVIPTLTASPSATATPTATATPVSGPTRRVTATPRRSATATATATPGCVNEAEYLADLTVPDGAQYLPGQTFAKKWSVRNTGTCDWGPGYRLVFISGEPLTAPPGGRAQTEFALYPARAGTQAIWEIPMRAPETPGVYLGRWQARDAQGSFFGGVVYVEVEVVPLPAPSAP